MDRKADSKNQIIIPEIISHRGGKAMTTTQVEPCTGTSDHYTFMVQSGGHPSALTALAALAVMTLMVLGGCSGGDSPAQDPLTSYKAQVLNWQDCDPAILGVSSTELMQNAQTELGERLKCATVSVPLDYDTPGKADLKIAVMRTAAARPALRRGAIFFNPGGPGVDGLVFAAHFGRKWNNLNPANTIAAELKRVSDQYDLIGFSPRGVGASTQLICADNEPLKSTPNDRSNQTILNQLYNSKLIADACLKNPITPYITTEQTVRDLDLIRHLLGDEKINYIGYSYGTWLGSWYASRFPERTGRMLLDSNMDFSANFDAAKLMNAMGRQRALDQLLAPYAARNDQKFSLGTDANFISRTLPAGLNTRLFGPIYSKIDSVLGSSDYKDNVLYYFRIGQVMNKLLLDNSGVTEDQLVSLVMQTTFLTATDMNTWAQKQSAELGRELYKPAVNLRLSNEDSVFNSVACNDAASTTDEWFWIDQGNLQSQTYPFSGGVITENPCIYWGGPRVSKPPLGNANKTAEGLLLLQSRYDTRTPPEGALQAFSRLTNASMIMVENEYSHGLFPYDTECVDLAVARYFNDGILPARTSSCNGKDAELATSAAPAAKKSAKSAVVQSGIYLDPEKDREITILIKSMIR